MEVFSKASYMPSEYYFLFAYTIPGLKLSRLCEIQFAVTKLIKVKCILAHTLKYTLVLMINHLYDTINRSSCFIGVNIL